MVGDLEPLNPMALRQELLPYPHWLFSDPAGKDKLRFVPERGGLLTGWQCNGAEIIYLDEQRFLDPSQSIRGGAPVLFPICGTCPTTNCP